MTLVKNTVRLKAEFYNFAGVLSDPSTITLIIIVQTTKTIVASLVQSDLIRTNTGMWYYDFIVPVGNGNLIYEWSGILEGNPIVNRGIITREQFRA